MGSRAEQYLRQYPDGPHAELARKVLEPRVGVAAEDDSDATRNRIIQELEAKGYEVREVDRDDDTSVGLSARLVVRTRRIEVKVSAHRNGGIERREAVTQLGPHDEDLSTATTRAMEFLRASLIEVGVSPPRAPAVTTAGPRAEHAGSRPSATEAPSTLDLGLGAGAMKSGSGLDLQRMFVPSVGWRTSSSMSLRMRFMIPFTLAMASGAEGEASVRATLFGLSLGWSPWKSDSVEPFVEAGLHAACLSIAARPADGYAGQDATRMMAAPLAGAGVVLFPGRLRLRLTGLVGTGLQRDRVIFEGRHLDLASLKTSDCRSFVCFDQKLASAAELTGFNVLP